MSFVSILNHICYNFLVIFMEYSIVEGKILNSNNTSVKDTGMLKFENLQIQSFSSVHYFGHIAVSPLAK